MPIITRAILSATCVALLLLPALLDAQAVAATNAPAGVRINRFDAGAMRTSLGYGVELNKQSTLRRQGIAVVDDRLPVRLSDSAFVLATYEDREYRHVGRLTLNAKEPVSAVEVRFLIFDVFGNLQRVLSSTEVTDLAPGAPKSFTPAWRIWSENDAATYYASIGYIARARTESGRVIYADLAPVLAEAKRFSARLNEADLAPKPAPEPAPR